MRKDKASRHRGISLALLAIGGLLLLPGLASADGGTAIASAPVVSYSQQYFGNTATAPADRHDCKKRRYWTVPVLAGDEMTVDWQSTAQDALLYLMPVGTTDFTLEETDPVAEDYLGDNGKSQLNYGPAPLSGLMPLIVGHEWCHDDDYHNPVGPYSFAVRVRHAVFTSLNPRANIRPTATLTGTAFLADGTPVPDGLAFTLTARWAERGLAQFSANSAGGVVSFRVVLPKEAQGRKVKFEISRGADAGLLATESDSITTYVARASKRVKRPRKCRKGFTKRKVKGKKKCVRKHTHRE